MSDSGDMISTRKEGEGDSLDKALASAVQAHRAGRLEEAERSYRQILAVRPDAPRVLRMLALAVHGSRRDPAAVDLLERVVDLSPGMVQAYVDLARVLRGSGRHAEAIDACRRGIEVDSSCGAMYAVLGSSLRDAGRFEDAVAAYRHALAIEPDDNGVLTNLAIALRRLGRFEEAVAAARRAVEVQPSARNHNNLGNALVQAGGASEALAHHRRAVELDADLPGGFMTLGLTLASLERFKLAEAAFRRALAQRPDDVLTLVARGNALVRLDRPADAEASFRRALELEPRAVGAWDGLASMMTREGRWAEADEALRRAYRLEPDNAERLCRRSVVLEQLDRPVEAEEMVDRALALDPGGEVPLARKGELLLLQRRLGEAEALCTKALDDSPKADWARFALGHLRLLEGRFREGFADNEARWEVADFARTNRHDELRGAQWDGTDPTDKTVLLWSEQGLGDALQFARYAPMVADGGARVVLAVGRPLVRLMRSLRGVDEVVERSAGEGDYDTHCPLFGLPHIFETEINTIPSSPYLSADPELVETWRVRLGEKRSLRVGLAWAGNPSYRVDRQRSLRVDDLSPLLAVEGVTFYSLQKGVGADRARRDGFPPGLIDRTDQLDDFMDTAALASNLDLVISTDTSVAHMAGALGLPVWVLLPYMPDWRWLLDRDDCPWYPSARLFRQPKPLDRCSPIDAAAVELAKLARQQPEAPRRSSEPSATSKSDEGRTPRRIAGRSDGASAQSRGSGMLSRVRQATQSRVARLLMGMIPIVFISLGIFSRVRGPKIVNVATVNGEAIAAREVQRAERRMTSVYRRMYSDGLPLEVRQNLGREALDGLIDQALLAAEAARRGIEVDDAELREHLMQDESLYEDARFSRERYQRALRSAGWTPIEYEAALRAELAAAKSRAAVADEVSVSDDEVRAALVSDARERDRPLPSESEIEERLDRRRKRLLAARRQSHVASVLEDLRSRADIEIDEEWLHR